MYALYPFVTIKSGYTVLFTVGLPVAVNVNVLLLASVVVD